VKILSRILTIMIILSAGSMISCNHKVAVPAIIPLHDTLATSVTSSHTFQDIPGIPDSAYIKALLQCDSLGNIYLQTIAQLQGESISQSIQLSGNEIKVDAKAKPREKTEVTRKDSVRTVVVEKAVPYPVERVTNELTSWQSFQIWTGRIVIIALLIYLAVKFTGQKLNFITKLFK
jgi:hypothetical protein